jgi:hypothetical protein
VLGGDTRIRHPDHRISLQQREGTGRPLDGVVVVTDRLVALVSTRWHGHGMVRSAASFIVVACVLASALAGAVPASQRGTRGQLPVVLTARDVQVLQKLSTTTGVGIVERPAKACRIPKCFGQVSSAAFFASTADAGRNWGVSGTAPFADGPVAHFVSVPVAFVSRVQGYVLVLAKGGALYYTGAGGRHWSRLRVPGAPTAMSLSGNELWVVSGFCPNAAMVPQLCPSRLVVHRAGALVPTAVRPLPESGGPHRAAMVR